MERYDRVALIVLAGEECRHTQFRELIFEDLKLLFDLIEHTLVLFLFRHLDKDFNIFIGLVELIDLLDLLL